MVNCRFRGPKPGSGDNGSSKIGQSEQRGTGQQRPGQLAKEMIQDLSEQYRQRTTTDTVDFIPAQTFNLNMSARTDDAKTSTGQLRPTVDIPY